MLHGVRNDRSFRKIIACVEIWLLLNGLLALLFSLLLLLLLLLLLASMSLTGFYTEDKLDKV